MYAFTTNVYCLCKSQTYLNFKNVLTLRLKLTKKLATLSVTISLLAKLKMNLRILLKIQNLTWNKLQTKAHSAGMQGWYQDNIITFEGCKIDIATFQFGTSQIIKEPTHILSNSASWIELSFTSQPNLVMHSGLHPSLHQNCHHQIVFTKFNLTFFLSSILHEISMTLSASKYRYY